MAREWRTSRRPAVAHAGGVINEVVRMITQLASLGAQDAALGGVRLALTVTEVGVRGG